MNTTCDSINQKCIIIKNILENLKFNNKSDIPYKLQDILVYAKEIKNSLTYLKNKYKLYLFNITQFNEFIDQINLWHISVQNQNLIDIINYISKNIDILQTNIKNMCNIYYY